MSDQLRAMAGSLIAALEPFEADLDPVKASALALAREWLREHPSDDGEPVTEEWIKSVGFENVGEVGDECWVSPPSMRCGPCRIAWTPLLGCDGWSIDGQELIPPSENRGDVRRLCAALGIPSKEGE